jgi:hypothetical protein
MFLDEHLACPHNREQQREGHRMRVVNQLAHATIYGVVPSFENTLITHHSYYKRTSLPRANQKI